MSNDNIPVHRNILSSLQRKKVVSLLIGISVSQFFNPHYTSFAQKITSSVFEVVPVENSDQGFALGGFTSKGENSVFRKLTNYDIVFLGEHHNSAKDHVLQARIIRGLKEQRGFGCTVAIGLEMIQQQFQSALDRYISRDEPNDEIAFRTLLEKVEWSTRWKWPAEVYFPIFQLARDMGLPLVALNVDDEALNRVRMQGFAGLTKKEKQAYIANQQGFLSFSRQAGYQTYVAQAIAHPFGGTTWVVMATYGFHAAQGLGGGPEGFYAARILWDQAMADAAARFVRGHPGCLLVALQGADHVKFRLGSPARLATGPPGPPLRACSVLLNPTAQDTGGGAGSAHLRLGLPYAPSDGTPGGALALSDVLWFSGPEEAAVVTAESVLGYLAN